ncbi:MAG TPA: EAL domain-containing protein [Solirubrobacteraceae bacterium]|nr:EAL domain-containing protein [Solirubrobacteraceae bacterium]
MIAAIAAILIGWLGIDVAHMPAASHAVIVDRWLIFGVLVAAVVAFFVACGLAARTSAELVRAEERAFAAHRLADERLHDPVTGLPSRELFMDRAETALSRSQPGSHHVALLFVDLDHFKRVNDSLGHAAGDELLREFARRLEGAIRPLDTVSRFGGDEFLILCDGLPRSEYAPKLAARVAAVLDQPFRLASREVHLTCSVGIAVAPMAGTPVDAATLVRDADAAMYAAKQCGGGGVRVFDAELHAAALQRLDTEVALRAALRAGQVRPYYQPIVELDGGETAGVEALARWERPGVGLVPPCDFIPAAEDCGLIDELGRRILAAAMADVDRWFDDGLISRDFWLSVNISPRQLADPMLPELVAELLTGWSLPPSSLCLEITESAVACDPGDVMDGLARLSALGLKVALDDFGVGQSSLARLVHSLPIDVLKLDRTFVSELAEPREGAVVAAVAVMARALGIEAVAEGVETEAQSVALLALGYTQAQGYHFGRAVDADRMRSALSSSQVQHAPREHTLAA